MEGVKGKIRSISVLERFKGVFLRAYSREITLQDTIVGQTGSAHKRTLTDGYHSSQKETGRAILKAECCKAMAIVERQKHPRLY